MRFHPASHRCCASVHGLIVKGLAVSSFAAFYYRSVCTLCSCAGITEREMMLLCLDSQSSSVQRDTPAASQVTLPWPCSSAQVVVLPSPGPSYPCVGTFTTECPCILPWVYNQTLQCPTKSRGRRCCGKPAQVAARHVEHTCSQATGTPAQLQTCATNQEVVTSAERPSTAPMLVWPVLQAWLGPDCGGASLEALYAQSAPSRPGCGRVSDPV